ncbi:unnamed protein product [Penicillium camemberti]|uniref:Str. FM013 n=1 Tax=Penicillium camemberti (strain FM 013) TaxID=1429867 RepID=A0A0G4NUR9_PENC3|nr:unnamed protein product [Penicillium camemberti]
MKHPHKKPNQQSQNRQQQPRNERTKLKIAAIIDWKYAGFWLKYFEDAFYERPGPSAALDAEVDDVLRLLWFLADLDVE